MPSREFFCVAACCRWPLSEPHLAAIRMAANDALDWPAFLRLAKRHRVEGLVRHAFLRAGIEAPCEVSAALEAGANAILYQNLRLAAESVRLQKLFDGAGTPTLFVKGVSLAMLAYGTLALKHGKDIDLLVDPNNAETAIQLLQSKGYRLAQFAGEMNDRQRRIVFHGRDISLVHGGSGIEVELHWRPFENPLLLANVGASSASQSVTLSGEAAVRTLTDGDLFCYLCAHGAHHGWFRLKWLADLNAYLSGRSGAEIINLYDSAKSRGLGICAGLALLLCHQLLGLEIPTAVAGRLKLHGRLRYLHALALDMMAGRNPETEVYDRRFGTTRINLSHFLLGQGWRFYLAECKAALIVRGDLTAYDLPVPLHFLYPVLRIPMWIWRRFRRMARMPRTNSLPNLE